MMLAVESAAGLLVIGPLILLADDCPVIDGWQAPLLPVDGGCYGCHGRRGSRLILSVVRIAAPHIMSACSCRELADPAGDAMMLLATAGLEGLPGGERRTRRSGVAPNEGARMSNRPSGLSV